MLRNARDFEPDLFLWVGYSNDAIPMMEQSKDIGFHPPIYAGWPPAWPEDVASLPLSDGVLFFSFWDEAMKNTSKASKDFSDAYHKEYKHKAPSLAAPLA